MSSSKDYKMPQETRDQIAQDMAGKPFDELDSHDKVRVGGKLGGGQMAEPENAPPPPDVKFGEDYNAGEEKK